MAKGNNTGMTKAKKLLVLIMSGIIAIALGITCGICFGTGASSSATTSGVESGEVTTSANKGALTGRNFADGVYNGTVAQGDYVEYGYNGGFYTVVLPEKTTIKLECWGAQGGGLAADNGGTGGYVTITITTTYEVTVSIVVGGKGTNAQNAIDGGTDYSYAGGYNGGGNGSGRGGPGGGGATHIVHNNENKLLKNTSSGNMVLVAGGGGGGTGSRTTSYSSSGMYGQGASGCHSKHNGSYLNDEGGGGGGFYGGAVYHGDDPRASYAGQNWINGGPWGWAASATANRYGQRSGHGLARITVNACNANPQPTVAGGATINGNGHYRGNNVNITVTPSSFARDPENTAVAFSDGAANRDTWNTAALFLNSACTTNASNYITYYKSGNNIIIQHINRYPRTNVDGQTNGVLTLYAKIRDSFGSDGTKRGYNVVPFKLKILDYTPTMRTSGAGTAVTNKGTYLEFTKSATGGNYNYRVGNSTKYTAADKTFDYVNGGYVYNPNGNNIPTVFIPQPLTPSRTGGFTIYAQDVFTDADATSGKNDIPGFKSIAASAAPISTYYTATLNANSGTYGSSGLYDSVTIKPTNLRPNAVTFVALQLTVMGCEQTTKAALPATYTSVYLVFKIANTRPFYATASSNTQAQNEPVINLTTGGSYVDLALSSFVWDQDGTTPTLDTSAGSLKVPTNEYVSVNHENQIITRNTGKHTNYSNNSNLGIYSTLPANAWQTGEGDTRIWRDDLSAARISRVIAQTGSAAASSAWVTYTYIGNTTIRFFPRAASQYMYKNSGRDGDFYIMVRVIDPGDSTDTGIWFPIAIKVSSSKPTEPATTGNITLDFNRTANADGSYPEVPGSAQSKYLTTISYTDGSGNIQGIGVGNVGDVFDYSKDRAVPIATDADNFAIGSTASQISEFNEIVALNGDSVEEIVNTCFTDAFFTVERVKLYAAASVFSNFSPTVLSQMGVAALDADEKAALNVANSSLDPNTIKSFWGLKVTANASTNNEYYEFDVKVKDTHGDKPAAITNVSADSVRVYVKVNNRAPYLRHELDEEADDDDKPEYAFNTTEYGTYVAKAGARAASVNYKMIAGQKLIITPYDLAYDFDSVSGLNEQGTDEDGNVIYAFNTNPLDDDFDSTATKILTKYTVKSTATPSVAAKPAAVSRGALFFSNKDRFNSAAAEYTTYLTATMADSFVYDDKTYAMSCIEITASSRTTANNPLLNIVISDGISTIDFAISITVENAAPKLKNPDAYYTLTPGRLTVNKKLIENSIQLVAMNSSQDSDDGITVDVDEDNVFFDGDEIKIVAYDPVTKQYYEKLKKNSDGTYTPAANGTIKLSDYISAMITSGTKNYVGSQVLLIQAKSSTQLFNVPIYVEFGVVDSWKAAPGKARLRIGVEVLNCAPTFETSTLTPRTDPETEEETQVWYIPYETKSQKANTRYIVNNKELYDSTAIPASASNKVLLFNDADSAQTVLLDTGRTDNLYDANSIVVKRFSQNPQDPDEFPRISETTFTDGTAVMYTRTYKTTTDGVAADNMFLDIKVIFFRREGSPEEGGYKFTEIKDLATYNNLDEHPYWAIMIKDNADTTSSAEYTQIAIRVKDSHFRETVYTYDKDTKALVAAVNGSSDSTKPWLASAASGKTVCNLYYQYLEPGIRAMHEYYRTDGQTESMVLADASKPLGDKKVDRKYLSDDMFVSGGVPDDQTKLASAQFTEKFRYRYFVNIATDTSTDPDVTKLSDAEVGKRYDGATADKAFYYEPVAVTATGSVTVPMSYIAMPTSFDINKGTVNSSYTETHVLPANVPLKGQGYSDLAFTSTDGIPAYVAWANTSNTDYATYRNLILDNLTLTDNDGNSWSGSSKLNDNPYITIEYTANQNKLGSYINYGRGVLAYSDRTTGAVNDTFDTSNTLNFDANSTSSPYLEDRYGFKITRKSGSSRYTGYLRLTVAVKTSSETAAIESAFVDIALSNSAPSVTYTNGKLYTEVDTGRSETDLGLTMADADGSAPGAYVSFARSGNATTFPAGAKYTYTINFSDADSTDVMMFYMPSATNTVIGGENGALTEDERAHIKAGAISTGGMNKYLNIETSTEATEEYMSTYKPNPGYEKFFTLGTVRGSTRTLQITPVAKTDLNIPVKEESESDEAYAARRSNYLDDNHLESDSHGIYYPFRVLAYDSCNGSGFTEGKWSLVVVKVHISNSPISANEVGETKLTKNIASTLDVSTLITDNDIPLVDGKYTTSVDQWPLSMPHDAGKTKVEENYALAKDTLQMPVTGSGSSATVNFTAVSVSSNGTRTTVTKENLPIEVSIDSVSPTTLVFTATSAFKTKYELTFTFKDSATPTPTETTLTIPFSYTNETPKENAKTFGGMNLNITMRTGDSFRLHAADKTDFANDRKGQFSSPDWFTGLTDYPEDSAETLVEDFKPFIGAYDEAEAETRNHELGDLIVGDDDAPSTVRFLQSATKIADQNLRHLVGIEFSNSIRLEKDTTPAPLTITVTAYGVVTNAELDITLIDSEGTEHKALIKVFITVESSAPTVKSDADLVRNNVKMEREDVSVGTETQTVYNVNLEYGGTPFEYEFEQFMDDVDDGDKDGFVAAVLDGSMTYKLTNSSGLTGMTITPVSVTTTSNLTRGNKITIKAEDYIPVKGEYTDVMFRVSDAHGTISDDITLRVRIVPKDIETKSDASDTATITVQSFLQYSKKPQKQVIKLVSDEPDALLVYDSDVSAPSASYDVAVYAMLMKEGDKIVPIRRLNLLTGDVKADAELVHIKIGESASDNSDSEIYQYVNRYFEFEVSSDGKTITFTPNAAFVNTDGTLDGISLYIEVGKRYKDGTATVMPTKSNVLAKVVVENSAPVATKSDGLNYGYPLKDGEEDPRSEGFLSFSGYAGDSLTWDLINPEDETLGLFQDYDLIKNMAGNEKLVFVAAKVASTAEGIPNGENILDSATRPNDPVLTITSSEETGKLTIKINRKVKDGTKTSQLIPIDIYVADRYTKQNYDNKTATLNDCAKTTINVTVKNNPPTFKEVDDVVAHRYTLSYDVQTGYEMFVTLAKNKTLTVSLKEILGDTDFDFDKYSLVATNQPYLMSKSSDTPGTIVSDDDGATLFQYYTTDYQNAYNYKGLQSITFKGMSVNRSETSVCYLRIADSSGSQTPILTVHLTVGNLAPKQKDVETRTITVMGVPLGSEDTTAYISKGEGNKDRSNVVYYVTDENPKDCIDVTTNYAPDTELASNTYIYIDNFFVYDTAGSDPADKPIIYGPGKDTEETNDEGEVYYVETPTVCDITHDNADTQQTFAITLKPGVYGTQRIDLRCYDGGSGSSGMASDAEYIVVELTVIVACPVTDDDVKDQTIEIAENVSRRITPELLLNTEEEPQRADGYKITGITVEGNLKVIEPTATVSSAATSAIIESAATDSDWRVLASRRGGTGDKMTVTFDVGGITRTNHFNVSVTENHKPTLNAETIKFTKSDLLEGNIIKISPEDWFTDSDVDDVMRFVSPVKVASSQYADAFLHENTNSIDLKFKYRGTTTLTVTMVDSTNKLYTYELNIECTDMPEPGWFTTFVNDIELHPIRWGLIFGGILLFIILLIILIVVICKRRRMRREIELLLNSEAELNEEMMRLNSGASATMYQSYGYLPPTTQTFNDPGLMLGSSANNPTPNSLQLGMGTGQNMGVQQNSQGIYPQTGPRYNNIPTDSMPGTARPGTPPVNSVPGNMPNNDGFDPNSF